MLLLRPTTTATTSCEWPKPKARRHYACGVSSPSGPSTSIINTLLGITAAMLATIALGSITTATPVVTAAASAAAHPTNRPLHSQGNYQGVDAISALTGLSNGYMQSYYDQQLRNAAEHQQQQQQQQQQHHHHHVHSTQELADKEATGRGLQLHASHYGNGVGGGGPTTSEALEIFNVPDSGFIPTTLSAAGQHYASAFLGFAGLTDKNNAQVSGAASAAASVAAVNNKIDLQQSAPATYGTMTAAHNLYGRLSNYDDLSGRSSGSSSSIASGGDDGLHNFALAYDNYAANLYNDPSTNEGEQQQNFANYFTPTTATATDGTTTSSALTYTAAQSPHKYLPLNNYHNNEAEHHSHSHPHTHHHYQQTDKQRQYSRATASPAAAAAPVTSTTFYENYNYPNNVDDNKQLVSSSYQTWNLVDKQLPGDYYATQQQQPQYHHQRQFKQDHDYKEPEMAESAYVLHTSAKRGNNKKSKRSDPLHETYDSYTPEHEHEHELHHTITTSTHDDAETIQLQQHQLEELHKQLQQQQQQFVTLQHQLIDHDQQLQIHKHQPQYQAAPPALPAVTHTIHHNPLSLQALAGAPLSKHTQIVRNIPVPQRQQIYVPTKQNVNVEVPDPIITTVSKPMPIEVPVTKTIAVPQMKEVKIPIERVKPYPVERPVPYIVEKRVPYAVEKQVAKPVYYNVPIKVPIVHTVVHKVHPHQPHPYSYAYQHQKQQRPIHYSGHVRHSSHHGGYGHFGGGHYLK